MKTLNQSEINIISGGISPETSYSISVGSGILLGAIAGTSLAAALLNPFVIAAGYTSYTTLGLSAAVGGIPGAELLSTAASLLWQHNNGYK
jgi:hypothetical protein